MGKQQERESVVQIDELNLDKECIRLPSQYLQWASASADAKRDVDELKATLDVVEAEISRDIRSKPGSYGLEKVTESSIKETILVQDRYKEALTEFQEAKHKADIAQAVVWALEHKKRTLTLLVELHGMGYFSNPKVSDRGREAVEKMTKRAVRHYHDEE
jgi:hypothetical protein